MLTRGLQASAHRHAEDHFFTYLKWSLDIMRDTALSVSKESIMKARVKQAQAGEKQKKMKESTLDNKKIKATSELNITAIESKGVLFSKFFESQNNCKKVALITPNRHIHYNLVVNFLSSKARDKFTSLLKSTFLALKSDPLELLHGSSKPTIDYTTVHDLLHFMSITVLKLTRDKPMHRRAFQN
eukprot:m51a1_g2509 hypothetical protein (185) ;mRNA; r:142215-146148